MVQVWVVSEVGCRLLWIKLSNLAVSSSSRRGIVSWVFWESIIVLVQRTVGPLRVVTWVGLRL